MEKVKETEGGITSPKGFKAGTAPCGIKYKGRDDLAVIVSDVPAMCAGVFTSNRIQAAPVIVLKEHLKTNRGKAIVANSGNANACTGKEGIEAANETAGKAAVLLGCKPEDILVASTGVIGRKFPTEKVLKGLESACRNLSEKNGHSAAKAIMTTDTFPKETSITVNIAGTEIKIGAVSKGAGMICPNMATLLCFITTDADIFPEALKIALKAAVDASFNCITVDGDMSTNDTVFIMANGMAGNKKIKFGDENFETFFDALREVCLRMAKAIIRDGEGATKFITINVSGAPDKDSARKTGMAIANSPLVKTAFFGRDPNWGRIICAAGYSGTPVEEKYIKISIGGIDLFEKGTVKDYNIDELIKAMSEKDIELNIDLGLGNSGMTIYTTDMSYDYIKINAEYTT
jgi:glutamate N-acetyltransferase / amino-acid N-acetyltransferase